MKIYDISQEVFGCQVYAGDPAPEKELLSSMEEGGLYNLTAFRMCAHNGTHIDAPFRFIQGEKAESGSGKENSYQGRRRGFERRLFPECGPSESIRCGWFSMQSCVNCH